MILSKINKDIKIDYQEKDFPEITAQYLSCDKIKSYTGWKATTPIEEGISNSIKMYTKMYNPFAPGLGLSKSNKIMEKVYAKGSYLNELPPSDYQLDN